MTSSGDSSPLKTKQLNCQNSEYPSQHSSHQDAIFRQIVDAKPAETLGMLQDHEDEKKSDSSIALMPPELPISPLTDDHHEILPSAPTRPQHIECADHQARYYRVAYRGVVALLSEPDLDASKSGSYLSYGEILASRFELRFDSSQDANLSSGDGRLKHCQSPPSPQSQESPTRDENCSMERAARRIIRVDEVLTGGYSVDANNVKKEGIESSSETPKRSNVHMLGSMPPSVVIPSPQSSHDMGFQQLEKRCEHQGVGNHGFIISHKKTTPIVEELRFPPTCQVRQFVFKVLSTTPIPILTGPSIDAPKTKAVLLPGSVHEVCLRIRLNESEGSDVWFLRLSRRKGWIPDRKLSVQDGRVIHSALMLKEIKRDQPHVNTSDDSSISLLSLASTSSTLNSSVSRRRHRPPRRQRASDSDAPGNRRSSKLSVSTIIAHQNHSDFGSQIHHSDKMTVTPLSNLSILSDDSSLEHHYRQKTCNSTLTSPDRSAVTRSTVASSTTSQCQTFYLMKVNAPRGLRILDAPHFQVNNLIHGKHYSGGTSSLQSSSTAFTNPSASFDSGSGAGSKSIFHTMSGRFAASSAGSVAVFDSVSKTRVLPYGTLFESSKRIENTGSFQQGSGLIKLSDNSGWAIVPHHHELEAQYRNYHSGMSGTKDSEVSLAVEEVGNAVIDSSARDDSYHDRILSNTRWVRVVARGGAPVSCPTPAVASNTDDSSPTSSTTGSTSTISATNVSITGTESDVASSVGSSFLDTMFGVPRKRDSVSAADSRKDNPPSLRYVGSGSMEKQLFAHSVPCGMCVEVERSEQHNNVGSQEYLRLRGAQGWVPARLAGKEVCLSCPRPEIRYGSFWFRVKSKDGIKVRLGPSRKAPSIKSDSGVYFRFECGEYLRASEIMTLFHTDGTLESFAKLYRNRHVRLQSNLEEVRSFKSLTAQAEWVQINAPKELYLEQCGKEPRVERHRQGWRYDIVSKSGALVRKGPSFASEATGTSFQPGETIHVNERVTGSGDSVTWLRLKDGQGWIHNLDQNGEEITSQHLLRHRTKPTETRPKKPSRSAKEEIAYNTIITRLFHNDLPGDLQCSSSKPR